MPPRVKVIDDRLWKRAQNIQNNDSRKTNKIQARKKFNQRIKIGNFQHLPSS
jgi:hypothetical protein